MTIEERNEYEAIFKVDGFIGVFSSAGYGVYDNERRFREALQYNRKDHKIRRFATYNEAYNFAQSGLSKKYDIPIEFIPKLRYPKNWMERIPKEYLRGGY